MALTFRRLAESLRTSMFPTDADRELQRWYRDGGDEALRYNYDLSESALVLDVGGYKGQFASDIYSRFNCRILIFEPVEAFATQIKNRFRRNAKIEVIAKALGSSRRKEAIALCNDGSSTWKSGPRTEDIYFEDVALVFSERKITNIDLLKVNIEGGEYELLQRLLETDLIKQVKNIQVQFHRVAQDSERRMEQIRKDLSTTHTPIYQYRFVWENWRLSDA